MTSTVLIIEDVEDVRTWLAGLAQQELAADTVYQAGSVGEGLRLINEHRVSLALIDLGLPDGSGTEIIRALKQQQPDCYCVVTTIFDDSENLFNALHAGADGYVLKDEPEHELINNLRGILDGRPPLSAAIAKKILNQFRPVEPVASPLTTREEELLTLITRGFSVPNASKKMGISAHTGAGYLKQVYRKLQVSSRAEATIKAVKLGIVNIEE
ncbi:MAG: response regulator transcription factor [Alcanivoracaceae bacterium]|nr:response regulator transcription factor [Alcanivoracaceae bacterium]